MANRLNRLFIQVFVAVTTLSVIGSGLKCWSTDDQFRNKRDPSVVIREMECESNVNTSCKGESYQVGRQWFFKLGCSDEDKTSCNTGEMGEHTAVECFCKSDYCNNALTMKTNTLVMTILTILSMANSLLKH